jgi:hypothetical protein
LAEVQETAEVQLAEPEAIVQLGEAVKEAEGARAEVVKLPSAE